MSSYNELVEQRKVLLAEYEAIDLGEVTDYAELSKHGAKRNKLRQQIRDVTADLMALQVEEEVAVKYGDSGLLFRIREDVVNNARKYIFEVYGVNGMLLMPGKSYTRKYDAIQMAMKLRMNSNTAYIQCKDAGQNVYSNYIEQLSF
jgi:hypothetical protein